MLIAIDGNEANVEKRVGVGRYAFELLRQLSKMRNACPAGRRAKCELRIYLKDQPRPDLPKESGWWKYQIVGPRKFWTQFGLPLALWKEKVAGKAPDVFFTPSHYAPRLCPSPRVISLMDLAYLYFPQMFRKRDLRQLKNWTAYSVKKASRILTISQSNKDDIIKYYKVPQEKVVVTYPGIGRVSSIKYKVSSMKNIREKYGIEGDFILYVGTLQPRKNLGRLIEALAQLEDKNLKLVIVGKKGWLYEEIFQKVKDLGLIGRVIFTGFVPDEDLPAFYQKAQCFVLVSLYEGFGLPVLEAMYYRCPVVASNISSLPEVVGKAGVLVDPYNVNQIVAGIKEAIGRRPELIKKGLQQCRQFSWEKCAKQTLAVLEDVAKNY